MKALLPALFLSVAISLAGCDVKRSGGGGDASSASESDMEFTAEEQAAIAAAKPFLNAIAAADYPGAYALLSRHGKTRMSRNQFAEPKENAELTINEASAIVNPTAQDFAKFMQIVVTEFGTPSSVLSADGVETDPTILSGKGDAMESAFTIGRIPETIPASIRKASVRAQIGVRLSPAKLKEAADSMEMTVEALQSDADFQPYFNLKVVLVEEDGALRVGYFEFTPPNMWD